MRELHWGMLIGGLLVAAGAAAVQVAGAQVGPNTIPGCIYLASPPTLTNGQRTTLLCDSTGKLRVTTS